MKLYISYCEQTPQVANNLRSILLQNGEMVGITENTTNRTVILEQINQEPDSWLILLLNENFLKSAACMEGMLNFVQALEGSGRVMSVLVDSSVTNPYSDQTENTRIDLDRSSIVIQYQNYWTDTYLSLRKEKWNVPSEKLEAYEQEVSQARNISNEIAAFLRLVRNAGHQSQEDFQANDYQVLYDKLGIENVKAAEVEVQSPPAVDSQKLVEKEEITDDIVSANNDIQSAITQEDLSEDNILQQNDESELIAQNTSHDANSVVSSIDIPSTKINEEIFNSTETVGIVTNSTETEESIVEEVKIETPIVEEVKVATPIVEEVKVETPIVEEVKVETPIVEEVKIETPIVEEVKVATPIVEEVKVQTPIVEEVKVATPIVEEVKVQTPIVEEVKVQTPIVEEVKIETPIVKEATSAQEHIAIAKALFANGKADEAKDHLEDAIHFDRKNETAHLLLGQILESEGSYLASKNAYERVLMINADNAEAYYHLGSIVAKAFPKQYTIAAEYYRRGLELAPDHAEMHYQFGLLLANQFKRVHRAKSHFKNAIRSNPEHAGAYYELANLYQNDLNIPEKARRFYLKACSVDTNLHTIENNLRFGIEEQEVADYLLPKAAPTPKKDTTIFITGATSGIGLATAHLFAEQGYRLILNGRRTDRLEKLKNDLTILYGVDILLLPFDVRNAQAVRGAIENLPENWHNIDILVNNAGLAKGLASIHEGRMEDWEVMIDTNIKGLLFVTRAVSPLMVERKRGHIINVGSIAAKEAYFRGNVYCATKAAVDMLTKGMRLDLYKHNIRVAAIHPGHVEDTEFALVRFDGDTAKSADVYANFRPLAARDVAKAILQLVEMPEHVGIQEVVLTSVQQANATNIDRSGRHEPQTETVKNKVIA